MICTYSGIEVTKNNSLFLVEDVPYDGCRVLGGGGGGEGVIDLKE